MAAEVEGRQLHGGRRIKRTKPDDLVTTVASVAFDDENGNPAAVLSVSIASPKKEDVCKVSDFITYEATAELRPPFPAVNPINPGGEATQLRHFLAYRDNNAVKSSERTANKGPSLNGPLVSAHGGHDMTINNVIYRLYVETKRVKVGGATVEVHARAVLKKVTIVNQQRTEKAVRSTTWALCDIPAGN